MLDVEELLELEDNIRKELDDHLPAALSMLNRTGELETFLKMLGMEDLLQSKPLYQVYKTGKIIVIGRSDVKAEVLLPLPRVWDFPKNVLSCTLIMRTARPSTLKRRIGSPSML